MLSPTPFRGLSFPPYEWRAGLAESQLGPVGLFSSLVAREFKNRARDRAPAGPWGALANPKGPGHMGTGLVLRQLPARRWPRMRRGARRVF